MEITAEFNRVVFSTSFAGGSVSDLYPCRKSSFHFTNVILASDYWRAFSGSTVPYNWRDTDFNDAAWSLERDIFELGSEGSLYLRKKVEVGVRGARDG